MKDKDKSKAQLIEELKALRSRSGGPDGPDTPGVTNRLDIASSHAFFENISDLAYICDDKGNVIYLNHAFEKMTGHKPEKFKGKPFAPLFDEENLKKALDAYQKTLNGESTRVEIRFKDSGILCAYSNIPYKDNDGKIIGILGTARDVTDEKKETELALNDAKETYASLFLNSQVGMSRTRLSDGKFLEINDRLVEMFGYDDREDFLKNYSAVKCYATPGERERALGIMKEFGEIKNFQTLAKRKDGSTFWIEYSGRLDKDGGYLDAVSLDINERKEAENALRKNEELLQSILDNTTAVIYVKDPDGKYLHSNSMHKKLFLKDDKDIIGKDDHHIFPKDIDDAFRVNDLKVLQTNAPVEFEEVAPHDDGPHTYISIKFPINDEEGNPYAVCGISTDITERKKTSERIEALNRCFLDFGTDPTENIMRLTNLLGTLMNGTCALYNRIDNGLLYSIGQWQAPFDYNSIDKPEGHICYDLIMSNGDDIFYLPNLSKSLYAKTDNNVIRYNLQTYLGKAVTCNGVHVGSLCVVFQDDFVPTEEDRRCLEILTVAVGIEEERKQVGEDLSSSREKLRHLSLHLQTMQEQERARIARDIHDDLGQILTALDFDISYMAKKLLPNQKELIEKTKKMSELIKVSTATVQRIASELRPALLDDLGLMAAMEWQADEYYTHTGIDCEVIFDPSIEVKDKNLSTALFRAFQEALTNTARHADATNVSARVQKENGSLVLQVSDNGKGIKEKDISDRGSFGLSAMRERFYPFGGDVRIEGKKDKGTTIYISLPFKGAP